MSDYYMTVDEHGVATRLSYTVRDGYIRPVPGPAPAGLGPGKYYMVPEGWWKKYADLPEEGGQRR